MQTTSIDRKDEISAPPTQFTTICLNSVQQNCRSCDFKDAKQAIFRADDFEKYWEEWARGSRHRPCHFMHAHGSRDVEEGEGTAHRQRAPG